MSHQLRFKNQLFDFGDASRRVPFADPLLHALVETRAFRRLRHVRFLGGIDYLLIPAPNGARGNIRHTRYDHSLGVAALSLTYTSLAHLSPADRRLFAVAALLHDIGHAPLSHSVEPTFFKYFGINHHLAARDIILGRVPLGGTVYELLKHNNIDISRLLALIDGTDDSPEALFFSGPINFDTIEGIIRSQQFAYPNSVASSARDIIVAAVHRRGVTDRRMVDNFWLLKNEIYTHLINSSTGFLADLACQAFLEYHISSFNASDFLSTEPDIFLKIPGLRTLLTSEKFFEHVRDLVELPAVHKVRTFHIDERGDFYGRNDHARYNQRKSLRRLELPIGMRRGNHRAARSSAMTAVERAASYSNGRLDQLRTRLRDIVPPNEVVVTCGSYARREASASSDLDFFVISSRPADTIDDYSWVTPVEETVREIVLVEPAADGAFAQVEHRTSMLQNVGGEQDTNAKFTRRMLLLLEGEWLSGQAQFKDIRRNILERYIGDAMTDHQLALFLLNDIIRYYRTIAVDYEFKTSEGQSPKPWGLRNIKLIFSRKLLYASGLFSIGLTVDRTRAKKIEILEELFSLPVLLRMDKICGNASMAGVRASYDYFLGKLEDPEVRERLRKLRPAQRRDDPLFRDLKNEGHNFTRELLKLFEATFDATHPLRKAVIF